MTVMPHVIRTVLPQYRITVPSFLSQAVSPVYLGMPPLPIGTQKPIQAAGLTLDKGAKVNVANFSGISDGSGVITLPKESTNSHRRPRKSIPSGNRVQRSKSQKGNYSKSKANPGPGMVSKKNKANGRLLSRNKNGRFQKK